MFHQLKQVIFRIQKQTKSVREIAGKETVAHLVKKMTHKKDLTEDRRFTEDIRGGSLQNPFQGKEKPVHNIQVRTTPGGKHIIIRGSPQGLNQ